MMNYNNNIKGWTDEIEDLSEKLRINCVNLSEYHRRRYYNFKEISKYFRIPLIILASITSTSSIALQPFISQLIISLITCILGMIMGVISSIELYLDIHNSMMLEFKQSKQFYTLSIDIFKTLSLSRENRTDEGKDYLNEKYSEYVKLIEASNLLKRKLSIDLLTEIPSDFRDINSEASRTRPNTPLKKNTSTNTLNEDDDDLPPLFPININLDKPELRRFDGRDKDRFYRHIEDIDFEENMETESKL